MLQSDFEKDAISQYLGTYTNTKLGNITLKVEVGKLILSTGGLTSELRQLRGPQTPTFVLADVPWVVLGMWTLRFEMDASGNPTILLIENNVPEPFVFIKKQ